MDEDSTVSCLRELHANDMDSDSKGMIVGLKRNTDLRDWQSSKRARVKEASPQAGLLPSESPFNAQYERCEEGARLASRTVCAPSGDSCRVDSRQSNGSQGAQGCTLSVFQDPKGDRNGSHLEVITEFEGDTCQLGEVLWEDWQDEDAWEVQSEEAGFIDAVEEGDWMDIEENIMNKDRFELFEPRESGGGTFGTNGSDGAASSPSDRTWRVAYSETEWTGEQGDGDVKRSHLSSDQTLDRKSEKTVKDLNQWQGVVLKVKEWHKEDDSHLFSPNELNSGNHEKLMAAEGSYRSALHISDEGDTMPPVSSAPVIDSHGRGFSYYGKPSNLQSKARHVVNGAVRSQSSHLNGTEFPPSDGRSVSSSQLTTQGTCREDREPLALGEDEQTGYRLVGAMRATAGAASVAAATAGVAMETAAKKLVQGTLTAFLGIRQKENQKLPGGRIRKVQTDIGSYFGLRPLNPPRRGSEELRVGVGMDAGLLPLADYQSAAKVQGPSSVTSQTVQRNGRWWRQGGQSKNRADAQNNKNNPKIPMSSGKPSRAPRPCPFYKKIPGTSFTVDAFKFGAIPECSAYFLTHFHSDHYGGLTKSWCHGPIYCTPVTARLVTLCLGVDPRWLCSIKIGSTVVVDGVEVTPVPANHCPGAALILFQLPSGQSILHTGDFRACQEMQKYPHLKDRHISTVYLDTTYCNPKYCFPLQEDVIQFVVTTALAHLARNPRTLVAVGSYSVGKERVFLALAQALGVKIYVERRRQRVLESLDWPELADRLTTDGNATPLHVLPLGNLHPQRVRGYLQQFQPQRNAVLGFRPTGWTYSEKVGGNLEQIKPQKSGVVTVYGVPYSEHSSFAELRDFIQFLRPAKIIPTVNIGSAAQREQMQQHFSHWLKT